MSGSLTDAQQLKFHLLAEGALITERAEAALDEIVDGGAWSPADYASTKGVILRLEDDVWVNMPVVRYNPNVALGSGIVFDRTDGGFIVRGRGLHSRAEFWRPPAYLTGTAANGRPIRNFVIGHGDRARLSPTVGCAMVCDFCNIPFDDTYAGLKPVDDMLDSLGVAVSDPLQPARHFLISGGTPGPPHVAGLRRVYERVLEHFPGLDVDIMMVPVDGLFDLPYLDSLGLNEISINLEIYDEEIAARVMRHKHRQGLGYYLDFLGSAADALGGHRVRSMLMVGLESPESTLRGVRAILDRGCVPVLSPFLPDAVTPMARHRPPSAEECMDVFLRASELAAGYGVDLGPTCPPCTHNTLTLVRPEADGVVRYEHEVPSLFAGT